MAAWALAAAAGAFWGGIAGAGALDGAAIGRPTWLSGVALGLGLLALSVRWARRDRARGRALVRAPIRWRSAAWAHVSLLTGFLVLGAGWGGFREAVVRESPVASLARAERSVEVEGSLVSDVSPGILGWTATVRVESVGASIPGWPPAVRAPATLWAEGNGPAPRLHAGDRVRLGGVLGMPAGSFGGYLARRGYAGTIAVDAVRFLGPPGGPLPRAATAVRGALGRSLRRVFPPREAGLLMGLTLGDTSHLDPIVAERFRATGLTHLLAVSGENVAMFVAPILGLVAALGAGRRLRLAAGLFAVVFFVLLTRGEPSVLRASAMATLTMFGVFLGRPRSPPAIMGGAVLALLAVDPTLVFAVGFQLSVAATAGMALLASPLSERLRARLRLPKSLAMAAGTTLAAQMGVTPLLLHDFGSVPTVTILANVLAFPAVGPGMLLGLVAGGLGILDRALGSAVAWVARLPLGYLEGLAARLARSPLPTITSRGAVWEVVAWFAGGAALAWWLRRERAAASAASGRAASEAGGSGTEHGARAARPGRSRPGRGRRAAAATGLALLLVVRLAGHGGTTPRALTVTFFDVGQGDSALVRAPDGAAILIDGGPDPEEVATKLAALGVHRLDLMVATHAHADHVAGLPAVLARVPVGLVIDPGCPGASPFYRQFLEAVAASGAPFRHPRPGEVLRVGEVRLQVLGPEHCFTGTNSDPNNDSLVLLVTDGPDSVLFTGDAEQPSQTEILRDEASSLRAMLLKVPHHGGDTSLPAFLAAVGARLAVVSVGPNRYGHPVPALLARLAADGMRVLRTDRAGDVTVAFDGGTLSVQSSHG